jgi:Ran GTPase-activating protein (RanGAP) involved in mRNA processing and transport
MLIDDQVLFSIQGKSLKLDSIDSVLFFINQINNLPNLNKIILSGNTLGIIASNQFSIALSNKFNLIVNILLTIFSLIITSSI